jgi:hypothetical protein
VLYAQVLPTFDATISDEDSETLLSSLAVYRLRIPLMLDFFAFGRVGTLLNASLQRLFTSALYDLGPLAPSTPNADTYPQDDQSALPTASGVLLEEARHGPELLTTPLVTMLHGAVNAGASMNHRAPFVSLLLFLTHNAARILAVLGYIGGDTADKAGGAVAKSAARLLGVLEESVLPLLLKWATQATQAHVYRRAATILRHVAYAHAIFARFRSKLVDLEFAVGGLAYSEALPRWRPHPGPIASIPPRVSIDAPTTLQNLHL